MASHQDAFGYIGRRMTSRLPAAPAEGAASIAALIQRIDRALDARRASVQEGCGGL